MFVQTALLYSWFTLVITKTCYWNSKCGQVHFGAKTVYDDVRGDVRDASELEGCDPIGVWSLIRHGTRLPNKSNIANMKNVAQLKNTIILRNLFGERGELCAQDVSNLQKWSWNKVLDSTPSYLTTEGYTELYELGSRFHQKFFPLLQNLDHYHFRPTMVQRTIESASAFVAGLSQGYLKFEITNATIKDDVLRPYYFCRKYQDEVYRVKETVDEMNNHHNAKEFQQMLSAVQNRSGIDHLSPTNAVGLYDLCRFERAYSTSKTSPWCALFTEEDLLVLEYLNDIEHYYRYGYGSSINAKLGGPTLKDLFQNFQKIISGSTRSFTGYFTHDVHLQMVYTALGLYRDKIIISGVKRNPGRKWRTSLMTPFAANFIAVLHRCPNQTDTHQVQFFINEEETPLCSSRTCSWREFKDKFEPFVDSNLNFCDDVAKSTTNADIDFENK